ncbi:MAG: SDR family oxidoreductase [Myxococcota bacterium]
MRAALVTGAAHGIGAALAHRLARAGYAVGLLDRDREAACSRAREIEQAGGVGLALGCDVTDEGECTQQVTRAASELGGIDVLVNNAGITHVGRIAETSNAVLHRVMDVNFFGAVYCTRAALPSLLERRGCVAAISSVAGFAPLATRSGYVASKHALRGFFETLRAEHAGEGLGVTIVFPSFVDTGIGSRAIGPDGGPIDSAARTGVAHSVGARSAAETIYRGIERRRPIVWVGREARAAWWLHTLAPRSYRRRMLRRLVMQDFP